MHLKKRRPIISEEEVSAIFDDARVVKLASIGRLPANANKAVFSAGIREAARIGPKDAGGHPASNHVPFGGLCSGHQNRDGISGSGMRSGIL